MKEKQFKGVWLKFIAVLVAVAMVIPLAFSGWASTRAYADDGNPALGDTGNDGTASDTATSANDVTVTPIGLDHEFDSGLKLDNTISTSDFSAAGDATALGLTKNVWVVNSGGSDLYVDYPAETLSDGMECNYNDFQSKVIGQIKWSAENQRASKTIDVAGVLIDGKNHANYATEAKAAIQRAKDNNVLELDKDKNDPENMAKVQAYLDSRTDVPQAVRDSLYGYLGGSLRKLMKDPNNSEEAYLAEDSYGNIYNVRAVWPNDWFRMSVDNGKTKFVNLKDNTTSHDRNGFSGYNVSKNALNGASGNDVIDPATMPYQPQYDFRKDGCIALAAIREKAKAATEGAVVNVVWPYIGSYQGRKVGMKLEISNIDYELDARTASRILDGNYNDVMTPAFQIAGLPQFGIWQHNVNTADYDVKLFYIEDENGNAYSGTENYITPDYMQDVYFTFSSLSTYDDNRWWTTINKDEDGNIAPGPAGAAYDRGGIAVNEMIKPLSEINGAYVTNKTNVAKGDWKKEKDDDDKYYNIVSSDKPSSDVTGQALKYVYDCSTKTATLTPKTDEQGNPIDGYYYAYGYRDNEAQKANYYDQPQDKVGVDDFTLHAVTLQFTNVEDMRFNMNSTTNETWFSIYPQGMTYNTPDNPSKSMIAQVQKNVFDNDQQSAKENMVLPGDEVEIIVSQKVNELNSTALTKYDSFSMEDTVPASLEIVDYYIKTDGKNANGGVLGDKTQEGEANKVIATKTSAPDTFGRFDVTNESDGSTTIKYTFDQKFVNPSRYGANDPAHRVMPYTGENYYLVIKTKVKEDTDLGAITNKGVSKIGKKTHESEQVSINVVDESELSTKVQVADRTKPLTFEVVKVVPADATKITLIDNIDECFELDAEPVLYWLDENGNKQYVSATVYQGQELSEGADIPALVKFDKNATPEDITYHSNQAVAVTIENGSTQADKIIQNELAGKTLHLSLRVRIKDSVDDDVLLNTHGNNDADIPNTATVKIDNKSEDSNEVDVELVSDLRIEKATTDSNKEKDFEFTVTLKNKDDEDIVKEHLDGTPALDEQGNPQPVEFKYNVYEWEGAKEKAIYDEDQTLISGDVIKIKGTQWAIIKGLPIATKYSISERPAPGYTNVAADGTEGPGSTIVVDGDIDKVTGSIHTGEHARTRFVNAPVPDPQKRVTDNNEELVSAATLEKDTEEFTYTITQELGKDAAKVVMTDELDKVLELVGTDGELNVVDQDGNNVQFTSDIGTWSGYNAPVEELEEKNIEIETLKQNNEVYYVKATDGKFYTRPKNGDGKWYLANEDGSYADLDGNAAADGKDTSGASLAAYGDITTTIDNADIIPIVKAEGTKVTVTIPDNDNNVSVAANKTITITFKAKIKADADLSEYVDTNNKISVPNDATVSINNDPKITNVVTVTPPTPEPEKKVGTSLDDQAKHGTKADEKKYDDIETEDDEIGTLELTGRDQEFIYTVSNKIPVSAKTVVFADTLENVLEVVKNGDVYDVEFVDGEGNKITDAVVDVKGERIVSATIADATAYRGQTLTLRIKAKIKEGVTDSELKRYYATEEDPENKAIPNQGTVKFDDNPELKTNTVTVTPPDAPEKFVEGVQDANTDTDKVDPVQLDNRDQEFEYKVSQVIPEGAVNVVFEDTLEDVLEFVEGSATFSVDGVTPVIDGQKITATIADATSLAGQKVELIFKAKIKDGVSDTQLLAKYGQTTNIPNKAIVKIDDQGQTTNEVLVTPPPVPEKKVNNDVHAVLANKNEVFTYTVDFYVPEGAETVDFTDTVDDVLVPVIVDAATGEASSSNVTASVTGGGLDPATTKPFDGKTLAFTLEGDELAAVKGAKITVTFKAMFDQTKVANIETMTADEIAEELGYETVTDNKGVSTNIQGDHTGTPNTAELKIKPDNEYTTSNTVTVTPPSDEPGELEVTKTLRPEDEEAGLTEEELAVQFGFEVTLKDRDGNEVDASTLVKDPVKDGLQVKVVDAEGNEVTGPDPDPAIVIGKKITFKLRHGDVAKITGVPGQYPYAIVETATEGYEVDTKFNDEGTIMSGVTTTAPFVNKSTNVEPGNLDVYKVVTGINQIPEEYRDTDFVFEVDLEGVDLADKTDEELAALPVKVDGKDLKNLEVSGDGEYTLTTGVVKDGKIIAVLKNDETAHITGIPAGVKANTNYVVEEQEVAIFENTNKTNDTGTIASGNTVTAVFINEFHQPDVDPVKKVNGTEHTDLGAKDEVFTYTVTQFVPAGASSFHFEDTLNGQLEYEGDATVTTDKAGSGVIKTVAKPDGKDLIFDLTEDEMRQVVGHVVTVTFKAKYVAAATDETIEGSYVGVIDATEDAEEQIVDADDESADHMGTPNQAKTRVGDHEASTNTVTVTAPPDVEKPRKMVDGKPYGEDEDTPALKLRGREETFTYSVTQELPESINLKSLSFSDNIVDVLEFIPGTNANAKIVDENGDKIDADIVIEGQKITATPKSLEGLAGKTLTFSFDAKIKAAVTDEQLIAAYGNSREIPNEATVNINGSPIGTNEVKVVPPGEDEVPEKLVQADHDAEATKILSTLNARNEEFTYTVNQTVTAGSTYFELQDTIEDVLEFVGKNGGAKLTYTDDSGAEQTLAAEISTKGKTLTVKVKGEEALAPVYAKNVSLTFKAKISDGVTDRQLFDKYGSLEIPNEASVKFNPKDDPTYTNKVKVTPPPEGPEDPEKFVNGDKYGTDDAATQPPLELEKRFSEVTYTVVQKVPFGIARMQIIDALEHVLETSEDKVSIADSEGKAISGAIVQVIGNLVQAIIDDEEALAKLAQEDKSVVLTIGAKLRENVTDEQLIKEYGENREIPNTASVVIGNDSKTTNEVKITPPEEPEEPEKTINDQKNLVTLTNRDEEFTYKVTQKIPDNASEFEFVDQIDDCLTIISTEFDALSKPVDNSDLDNNLVKFTVADAEADRGRVVTLTIKAQFKDGIQDKDIIKKHEGSTVVPNEATVYIDSAPQTTNKVEVTPPPVPSEEPEKKVNGQDRLQLEEGQRNQKFTYTVSQVVPSGAVTLVFEDELESVLIFDPETTGNVKVTAGKTDITDKADIKIDGQKITVTFGEDTVPAKYEDGKITDPGLIDQTVTLSFDAKIKDSVTDYELIAKYGSTNIPNKATVKINGNPKSTNEVDVTPPPTPGENPEKKVGTDAESQSTDTLELENRHDTFTYTVTQKVLDEAVEVTFEDTIEPVLEFAGEPAITDDTGADVEFTHTIGEDGRTIVAVVKDNEATGKEGEAGYVPANSVAAGKTITLTFQAKLKAGVSDAELIRNYGEAMEIPNKATVSMNGNPKVTNKVLVTPPPVEREEPKKEVTPDGEGTDVDGKHVDAKLMNRKETFTYTISQAIPAGAVNVQFTDILEHVLETAKDRVTVQVDGKDVEDAQINVVRDRVVTVTVADATAYADKVMVVTINANIKDGVTDEELIKEYGDERQIPNEATVTIDGDGKSTNEVKVTPPEEPEDPVKKINGDVELVTLPDREKEFEYTVTQKVPENAKTVTITDTLESELEFVGMPKATAGKVSTSDQTVTVEIADATSVRGQEVTLTFKAKIKADVTDAQLLKREGAYKGTTVVPNKAEVKFDFENDPRSTNTVEVTPPPIPSEEPEKKVGKDADDQSTEVFELKAEDADGNPIENPRSQVFTYTVSQLIPAGAINVVFEDTLEDVLELSDKEKFAALTFEDGTNLPKKVKYDIGLSDDAQTVTATIEDATALADKKVTLSIYAKIKDVVTDKQLIEKYKSTLIPNKATVKINGNPKSSNEVKVTPPPTPGESPEKKVNGQKETYELGSIRETFEYTVTQKIPDDAETVEFSDTVENVLEIVGGVDGDEARFGKLTYADGTALEDTVDYEITWGETTQTILATIEDATAVRGKELMLTFTAKIKSGVTREQLVQLYGEAAEIPNTAVVTINDNPKASNTVKVTPPPSNTKEPEKKINGVKDAKTDTKDVVDPVVLKERTEKFTYTVSQKIPDGAVNVKFEDTLERVLEVIDCSINVDGVEPVVNGQTVTAEIADATDLAGKTVTLTIEAKIKAGVTDAELIRDYGEDRSIPNKATVTIDGKGKTTNEVLVTPPEENPDTPPILKQVATSKTKMNNLHGELAAIDEEYTYEIATKIPTNAKGFEVTDTIDEVLAFVSTKDTVDVKVGGTAIKDAAAIDKQKLTVTFNEEQVKANAGKDVVITFKAKIKVDDKALVAKYADRTVPNKASYQITNLKGEKLDPKDSNEVTVTPPTPDREDPKKTVDEKEKASLTTRDQKFTYKVTQLVPADATEVGFTDELEDVLEVVSATITKSKDASKYEVKVTPETPADGVKQVVTATATDAKADRGETVELTIVAVIKDDVTDEDLIAKYGSLDVPNEAKVTIDNNGRTTNKVTVTPPGVPKGSVEVRYVTTDKEGLDPKEFDKFNPVETNVPGGTDYTTEQKTFPGYVFVKVNDDKDEYDFTGEDAATGKVEVDKTKQVTYIYEKITPPEKAVSKAKLDTRNEVFTYTITQKVPDGEVTSIVFVDQLEKVLDIVKTPTVSADGAAIALDGKSLNIDTNNKVTVNVPDPKAYAGKTLTFTIQAKIKDGITDEELIRHYGSTNVPNKANVSINDNPNDTNEVTVTPPGVPKGSVEVRYVTTDKEGLDPKEFDKFNPVETNVPEGTDYSTEQKTFPGYIFVAVNTPDDEYDFVGDDAPEGKVEAGKTTQITYIYEKIEEPVKKVNKAESYALENRDEIFEYTVSQKVPRGATTVTFTDTLENVLEIVGYEIPDGKAKYNVEISGQTAIASTKDAKADWGEVVTFTIKAKIKEGISDATLIALYGTTTVPNVARVTVNGYGQPTNEVKVTPPPETPDEPGDPVKKINGAKDPVTLASRTETFEYTVSQVIPKGAVNVVFTDTLEYVLGVSAAEINVDGIVPEISEAGKYPQTVTATIEDATALEGQTVTLKITAFIREDISDDELVAKYGYAKLVPNEATVTIDDNSKTTNKVLVNPPAPTGSVRVIYMTEDGKVILEDWAYVQENRPEGTDYTTVEKAFPGYEYTRMDDNSASREGDVIAGKVLDVIYLYKPLTGSVRVIHMTEDGKVLENWADVKKDAPEGTEYTTEQMSFEGYTFVKVDENGAPANGNVIANTIQDVIYIYKPIAEEPPIEKFVNGKKHEDLRRVFEEFTYTVKTAIPKDAVNFMVTDTIEPVLLFTSTNDTVIVRVGGQTVSGAASISGQTLTVTIPDDVVAANPGAEVVVEFNAKFREGANTNSYPRNELGYPLVPNVADYIYTDKDGNVHNKTSDQVTVTPPSKDPLPSPPEKPEIKKAVNGDYNHADLGERYEVFLYTIETQISRNAESFVIEDTLVDELEFSGDNANVNVMIGGVNVTAGVKSITINGQTLTVELAYNQLVELEGQDVVVTFNAKVKEGAKLDKYNNAKGEPEVPNTAYVILNNDAGDHKIASNVVTVTPPDEPEKLILGISFSKRALGGTDELPGARLAVYYREADGTYTEKVEEWISEATAHEIELPEGEYVLVELEAPEGYAEAGPIVFRVKGGGTELEVLVNGTWMAPAEANTIIMYDPKEGEPGEPDTPTPGKKEDTPAPAPTPTPTPTPVPTTGTKTPVVPSTTRRVVTPSTTTAATKATSTGDSNATVLWIVLAAVAAAAAAGAAVMVHRRRREDR